MRQTAQRRVVNRKAGAGSLCYPELKTRHQAGAGSFRSRLGQGPGFSELTLPGANSFSILAICSSSAILACPMALMSFIWRATGTAAPMISSHASAVTLSLPKWFMTRPAGALPLRKPGMTACKQETEGDKEVDRSERAGNTKIKWHLGS
jgi:hypothetical protein